MGSTIGSHAVVKAEANAYSIVDGTSRNMLETELGRRVEAKLAELEVRTEQMLRENRREVLAIAHALETYKTVTGEDIEAIIEGHQGPLVDGRPYHNPQFLELAEQYHARAVAAHQGHSRVDVPLPRWSTNGSSNGSNGHVLTFEPPAELGWGEEDDGASTDDVPVHVPGAAEAEQTVDAESGEAQDYIEEAPPAPETGRRRRSRE
jgi:hypothetical protein